MSRGPTRAALGTLGAGLRQLLAVRWVRVLVLLAVLALCGRLALEAVLSAVVSRLAAQRELTVAWEDLDLSVVRGQGVVRWLSIAPLVEEGQPADPLLELEYAVFDLDVLELLRGELSVRRAEVDGMDVHFERAPDGRWNFEQHVDVAEVLALVEGGEEPPPVEEVAAPPEPRPIELVPPVAVEALRLQHVRLHLADRAVTPERTLVAEAGVRLSSLRTSERPTRFSLELSVERLLDKAWLEGEARWTETGLQVSARAQAGALRPQLLADYLEPLRLRPAAETIEGALQAELELAVVGEARDALAVRLELSDLRLTTDGRDPFALERLALEVESVSTRSARGQALEVTGARGRVELGPDGALRLGGFDLLPPPRSPSPPSEWSDVVDSVLGATRPGVLPKAIALLGSADPDAYSWSLQRIRAGDCAFEVVDRRVESEPRFVLRVESAELTGLAHDPVAEPVPVDFEVRMSAPELAESIHLTGSVLPWAPHRRIDLELAVDGIAPAAADVYLSGAGLERVLSDGSLKLTVAAEAIEEDGVTRGWIEAREVALVDSGELFGVREMAVRDVVVDPAARRLRLGEMVVSGPRLALVRDPADSFLALGLRTAAAGPAAEVPDEVGADEPGIAGDQPQASAGRDPVVLEIGRVAWLDSTITFVDESTDPPTTFALDELGLELTELVLGGDPAGPAPPPARIAGHLRAEGLAEELTLEGLVRSRPGAIDLEAEVAVHGAGLRGALLAPYTRPFGIEPLLTDGRLELKAVASLRAGSPGWTGGLRIDAAELTDGGETLLSLEALSLQGVGFHGGELEFEHATVTRPFARIARDATGGLVLGGVRVAVTPSERAEVEPIPWPELPPLRFDELTVEGARVAFASALFRPPLELELELDAHVSDLARDGRRVPFEVDLAIAGALDHLALRGELAATPTSLELDLDVEGGGIRAGPLAVLLPRGVELEDGDGRLAARLAASVQRLEGGARAARLQVENVRWGEGDQAPWLALERLQVDIPRIDPVGGELELATLRTEGLEVAARRDTEGVLHALGLRFAAPGPEPGAEAPTTPAEVAAPPDRRNVPAPRVTLGDVRLAVDRFELRDETLGVEARPLSGSVALAVEPGVVLQADPADLPPLSWSVEGALDGLVEHWRVDGTLAPFASEPRLEATLTASGVRTAGLVELVPALAGRVAGELEQGVLGGHLEAHLFVRRSHPADLGLDEPFSAELRLADVAFRDGPGGAVLAGVEGIDVEVKRIDPERGLVHLSLVELRTPRARLSREGTQVHALGLVVELAAADAEGAPAPADAPAGAGTPAAEVASDVDPGPAAQDSAGELRLDRLVLSGLDVELADRSVTPAVVLPLTVLEFETGRVWSRAVADGGAISFSGELGASAPADGPPAFEGLSLAGRVAPLPDPQGWVQLQLSGLELTAFAGLAAQQGLAIDDGALDLSTRVRLEGERGASAGTSLVFSDLDVSEPEGGFLESLLSLPVTLDTALFLLRNADGEHRFSVDVDVGPEGVGTGAIAAAAASAFVQVLGGAIAGAPLRLIGSLVPGGEDDEEPPPSEVVALAFAPGSSELDAAARARLAGLAERLHARPSLRVVMRHELATADLERAARLANPSQEECLELVAGLRQQKVQLWRRRDALAAQARALYAVGAAEARPTADELRVLEVELADVELSLDRVLAVLRSSSPRQQAKRARAAAREIAALRLDGSAELLRVALEESRPERVEVRSTRSTPVEELDRGRVVIEVSER